MSPLVWAGVAASALALALLVALVAVPRRPRVEVTRLDPTAAPVLHGRPALAAAAHRLGDRALRRIGRRDALAAALERAGVHRPPAQVFGLVVVGALVGDVVGGLASGLLGGLLLALVAPVAAVVTLEVRSRRRRTAFAEQLDDTLRLMASSLRAGHSVLRALEAVSHDGAVPTSEEFARVLNEVRVGRDVVLALDEVAERMRSDDFAWIAQAVAIHREVGGNLAEVLDRVGATIRDRGQLRRQAQALSAEGRASAVVLLTLPIVVGGAMALVSPTYIGRLVDNGTGLALLVTAGLLMVVGALWVRRVVTVRF